MARQDVIIKLRLAGEDFDRDFKAQFAGIEQEAEKRSTAAGSKAGSGFSKAFAAGAAGLGAAIGVAISKSADLGAEIASTSRQFNIGAENLQIWRQAAANAGVSSSEFSSSLGTLTQRIGEANSGNRQAQQSFVALGIGFKDTAGNARATDAVMLDLAKRITAIEDPAKRVQVGMQLLGDDFKTLYPLLLDGADGLQRASAELGQFGALLTQEEIRNLEKTNIKIEQMKTVLSIRVASVVAENADSIIMFTSKLLDFSVAAIDAANAWLGLQTAFDRRVAGLPSNLSIPERDAAIGRIAAEEGQRTAQTVAEDGLGGRLFRIKDTSVRAPAPVQNYLTPGMKADLNRWLAPPAAPVESPRFTGGAPRRTGGGSAGAPRETPEERLAKQAAREAIRNEEQFRDALARSLRAQEDSAQVQRIRAEQGEVAAARAKAELDFLRQHPQAVSETVDQLAKALGITKDLSAERRAELQTYLDEAKVLKTTLADTAGASAQAELDREAQRQGERNKDIADRAAAQWQAAHEQAINNVANIYETAFRGGTKDLWANFKDEGTRMIAEIAAEWTLAMIAGQPFNFNAAASGAFGRSPLASIFAGIGGGAPGAGSAANDNGLLGAISGVGLGGPGAGSSAVGNAAIRAAGGGGTGQAGGLMSGLGNIGAMIPQVGMFLAASQVSNTLGGGLADLLGVEYSKTGGSLFGALGGFIGGALKGTKRGSVTVGGRGGSLGITGSQGNSRSREDAAAAGAGSLIDAIFQIADQLGGGVDASRGSVSFGMRKDSFRVDPSGRGATKIGNGAVDFGSDQEAAMRFAIGDLIKDGVITGISQASQNLLQRGGDLDQQIEKALLLEQIPKLLRQRTDPLGAALDDIADKFKRVNDALIEGSASAEQFAQARQLWELEKADAIASVGAASQSLKDFLASLDAGSNSPLSLREQREEAERQLQPYLGQIGAAESARAEVERLRTSGASAAQIEAAEAAARTAASAINQDGFTQASQLLLSISRQSNASSGAFFSDFDRIRALTGQAIGFVDQATARGADTRDPFARETAQNTKDTAYILADLSAESRAQGDTLRQIAAALSGGSGGGFIGAPRMFVNAV